VLSELLGIFIDVLTVMFGTVIFPANVWAVVADKLALSLNVVANEVPFSVIAGVVNVPPVLIVMFGANIFPVKVEELTPTSSACVVPQKNL
jgi:hypothetical protein